MATNNSINAGQSGIQSYDGAGTWLGRSLASSTANLVITNPDGISGNPTFSLTGFLTWNDVTGTTQAMSVSNGYVANNSSLVTFTLPATAALGDVIYVLGKGTGGWKINQNATQQIQLGKLGATSGTGGSIASTNSFDTVELRCITAGSSTVWTARVTGNITVI